MAFADAQVGTCEPPECGSSTATRLTREQVVDRIISINKSVTVEFLNRFPDSSLNVYLDHLSVATGPRGARSRTWVRPGDSPAIVVRESSI